MTVRGGIPILEFGPYTPPWFCDGELTNDEFVLPLIYQEAAAIYQSACLGAAIFY